MEIIFGVLSNKWKMEAEDMKVGKLAMMLFIGKKIAIVIYKPKETSFIPDVNFIKENLNYKRDKVNEAVNSIKLIRKKKVPKINSNARKR